MTGSYDCTAKIWSKTTLTEWILFHVISLHDDSIWDLKLKNDTLVTGGLDGVIGIFSLANREFQVRNLFKVGYLFSKYNLRNLNHVLFCHLGM